MTMNKATTDAPPAEQQARPSGTSAPSSSQANLAPRDSAPATPAADVPAVQNKRDTIMSIRPSSQPAAATSPVAATVAVAPPARAAAPIQQASAAATTPLGVWLTEEKEGKVRIEQCGTNLCGYAVNEKSDQNGEKVLINMKPVGGVKWSGKIYDPKSGSTYDSTIAMKGSDGLRVQGCAFGGMFCGGQTWSRLN